MRRVLMSLVVLSCVVASCGDGSTGPNAPTPTPTPDRACDRLLPIETGQYGSLIDPREFDASPATLPPWAFGSGRPGELPPSRVLDNLPAIAKQGTDRNLGSPGTCEAQSFGYGLGSYTAARFADGQIRWDPQELSNTVSAAFLWSIAVDDRLASCPSGGQAIPYLQRLVSYGGASTTQVPYEPTCCYLDSVDPAIPHADEGRFRIGSFSTFHVSEERLDLMRALLDAGHAIAFSGPVYQGYSDPTLDQYGVFGTNRGPQPELIPGSGHGQLVVGYDDTKGDPEAPGAFLVQNSFGPDWPPKRPGGRMWWAYQTFLLSQQLAAVAYSLPSSLPQDGKLAGPESGPDAYVRRAFQWVDPDAPGEVSLVIELDLSAPVQLRTIEIVEPQTGTQVTQDYDVPLASGYVFFRRQDGFQFLPGDYGLVLEATDAAGGDIRFSGSVAPGVSFPTQPEAMPIVSNVIGTIPNAEVVIRLPFGAAGG